MQSNGSQKSQTLKAVEDIRAMIFEGVLPAGTDHLETELAKTLGMSRTPIREATLLLEAQGLLEVRPRKGVRILSLSVEDMHEIYQVLTELESLAAFLAAERNYTKDELSKLAGYLASMETAVDKENRVAWAESDEGFHNELVRLAGNTRIMDIVSHYNDQVRRARMLTLNLRQLPTKSNKDHRELFDAIQNGDGEKARKIHWQHRTDASHLLTQLLEKFGLRHL